MPAARRSEINRRSLGPTSVLNPSTAPLWANNHSPARKGGVPLSSTGAGGVALRTAASSAVVSTKPAQVAKDRSAHIGSGVL